MAKKVEIMVERAGDRAKEKAGMLTWRGRNFGLPNAWLKPLKNPLM